MRYLNVIFLLTCLVWKSKESELKKKGLNDVLSEHQISDSMRRAIIGMTTSKLTKDEIITTIKRKLPNKEVHEVNDIIVAANAASGRAPPREHDYKVATEQKRLLRIKRHEEMKKELNRRKK